MLFLLCKKVFLVFKDNTEVKKKKSAVFGSQLQVKKLLSNQECKIGTGMKT